jgi:hypothetical protein
MFCAIKRDREGKLERVSAPDGGRSVLFDRIAGIPHIEDAEMALSAYKHVLGKRFTDRVGSWWSSINNEVGLVGRYLRYEETGEPRMFYRVGDWIGEEYREALRKAQGRDIEVGFITTEEIGVAGDESELATMGHGVVVWDREHLTPTPLQGERGEESIGEFAGIEPIGNEGGRAVVPDANSRGKGNTKNRRFQIKYRLNDAGAFMGVLTVKSGTDERTRGGFINQLILTGYLSGEKVRVRTVENEGRKKGEKNLEETGDVGAGTEYRYVGAGSTGQLRAANTELAFARMENRLGRGAVEMDRGTGTIRVTNSQPKGTMKLTRRDGRKADVVKYEDLRKGIMEGRYRELDAKYEGMEGVAATMYVREVAGQGRNDGGVGSDFAREEQGLKVAMLNILESLGVSVTAMTEYIEKYGQKNGAEIGARGLADIARQIVALASESDVESLTEETAHFVVEAYEDQAEIEGILPEVVDTDEYRQYADGYREIYRRQVYGKSSSAVSEAKDAEVERLVRREILGKLLAKEYANRHRATPRDLLQKIRDIWKRFIERLRRFFVPVRNAMRRSRYELNGSDSLGENQGLDEYAANSPSDIIHGSNPQSRDKGRDNISFGQISQAKKLQDVINRLADLTLARDMGQFKLGESEQPYIMYNASQYGRDVNMQRYVERMDAALAQMNRYRIDTGGLKAEREMMATRILEGETLASLSSFITGVDGQVNALRRQMEKARSEQAADPSKGWWQMKSQTHLDTANAVLIPGLVEMRSVIANSKYKEGAEDWEGYAVTDAQKVALVSRIDETIAKMNAVNSEVGRLNRLDSGGLIDRFCSRYNIPSRVAEWIRKYVGGVMKDCWWLTRMFGMLEHASNPILGMLNVLVSEANTNAQNDAREGVRGLFKWMDDHGGNMEHLKRITKDGYLIGDRDVAKFEAARRDAVLLSLQATVKDESGKLRYEGLTIEELRKESKKADFAKGAYNARTGRVRLTGLSEEEYKAFKEREREWLIENTEQRYTQAFEKHREDEYAAMAAGRSWDAVLDENGNVVLATDAGDEIGEDAKKAVRALAMERNKVLERFRRLTPDPSPQGRGGMRGRVDWVALWSDDAAVAALNNIAHARAALKSNYEEMTGKLKSAKELRIAADIRAMDEYYRDRGGGIEGREVDGAFMDRLRAIQATEGRRAAWEFVKRNGRITFAEESPHPQPLSTGEGSRGGAATVDRYREAVEEQLDRLKLEGVTGLERERRVGDPMRRGARDEAGISLAEDRRVRDLLDRIDLNRKRRSEILRQHRMFNNPSEMDYGSMSGVSKDMVRKYTDAIESDREEIYRIIGYVEGGGILEGTEYKANDAYYAALEDYIMGSEDGEFRESRERDFIDSHLSTEAQKSFRHFREAAEKNTGVYEDRELRWLKRWFGEQLAPHPQPLSTGEGRNVGEGRERGGDNDREVERAMEDYLVAHGSFAGLVTEYGKSLLLPYFRRFAPAGYEALLKELEAGNVDVVGMVQGVGDNFGGMRVELARDWYEDSEGMDKYLNPEYESGSGYGLYQPKASKYRNEEFFRLYNPVRGSDGKWEATTNKELWELTEILKGIKRKALENYGEGDRAYHSEYQLPQISRTMTNRILQGGGWSQIKNTFKDWVSVRVDDPAYGQTAEGEAAHGSSSPQATGRGESFGGDGELVMPKYYLTELEEASDVSTDLLYSYSMLLNQSERYRHNMGAMGEVMGLQQELLNMQIKGKSASDSNVYKMFRDHVDYHFYGKQLSHRLEVNVLGHTMDVGKVLHGFTRIAGVMNIGFSPIVAMTAVTTNIANMALEGVIGQYVNRGTMARALREATKMAPDFITEYGRRHKTTRLYVLGEHYGIYSLSGRARNSAYGDMAKALLRIKSPYALTEFLNSPFAPQVMTSVLMDTRLVDGRFVNFAQFSQREEFKGMKKGDVSAAWEKYEAQSLWDYSDTEDGSGAVRYDRLMAEGVGEDEIRRATAQAAREIRALVQKCDGTISAENKSTIARSYFMDGVMLHRGWLFQTVARRWKAEGFNFDTMQMEEGSYRTLMRFGQALLGGISRKEFRDASEAFRKTWAGLDDFQRTNMARVGIDTAFLVVLWLLAAGLKSWGDDDDEKDSWMVQMMSYVGLRTITEMSNQSEPMLALELKNMAIQPFTTGRMVGEVFNAKNWSWNPVKSGKYKGMPKIIKTVANQTWYKRLHEWGGSDDPAAAVRQSMLGYRQFNWLPFGVLDVN